jgi:hypothetical protein
MRCEHGFADLAPDVDSAVLAARVGVVAEAEGPQDRP